MIEFFAGSFFLSLFDEPPLNRRLQETLLKIDRKTFVTLLKAAPCLAITVYIRQMSSSDIFDLSKIGSLILGLDFLGLN